MGLNLSFGALAASLCLAFPAKAQIADIENGSQPGVFGETPVKDPPLSLALAKETEMLEISGGDGGAMFALLLGTQLANIPLADDLVIGVQPLAVLLGTLDAQGGFSIPVDLDNDLLAGLTLHFQAASWPAGNEQALPEEISPVLSATFGPVVPPPPPGEAEKQGPGAGNDDPVGGLDGPDEDGDQSRVAIFNRAPEFRVEVVIAATDSVPPYYFAQVTVHVPSGGHKLLVESVELGEDVSRAELIVETPAKGELVTEALEELRVAIDLGNSFERLEVFVDKRQRKVLSEGFSG